MIALVVVVIHEGFDMSFKITRQEVVFQGNRCGEPALTLFWMS